MCLINFNCLDLQSEGIREYIFQSMELRDKFKSPYFYRQNTLITSLNLQTTYMYFGEPKLQ